MTDKTDQLQTAKVPMSELTPQEEQSVSPPILWSPSFIAIFVLVLVLGLGIASILTQGWLNGYYPAVAVQLGNTALLFIGWLIATIKTRSLWMRLGAYSGCLWALFTAAKIWLGTTPSLSSEAIIHVNVGTNCALLVTYICLSIHQTAFSQWDTWIFRGMILLMSVAGLLSYIISQSPLIVEVTLAETALYLSIATWWLRPSVWKQQPGPAFLFGLSSCILILLTIPNLIVTKENNFFLPQVAFLCMLLGLLRIFQAEQRAVSFPQAKV